MNDLANYNAACRDKAASNDADISSGVLRSLSDFSNYASFMRIAGALTVIAAMSAFLLQGWGGSDDMNRYYLLLQQTMLLALAGFGMSYVLQENKSARVFFGLGLISITVNMTTLGALVFSAFHGVSESIAYPDFAIWQAADSESLLLAFGATILCSLPVAFFSHKVLARKSSLLLTTLFFAMNILLLIPVRDTWVVGVLAAVAVLVPLALLHKRLPEDLALRSPEGLFAMATVFIPAGIIVFRSLWLYPVDQLMAVLLLGTSYIALRFIIEQTKEGSLGRHICSIIATFVALYLACIGADLLFDELFDAHAYVEISAAALAFSALLLDIGRFSEKPRGFVTAAIYITALVHIPMALVVTDLFAGILCLLAAGAVGFMAIRHKHTAGLTFSSLLVAAGLFNQFRSVIEAINFGDWVVLSITGALFIIIASLLERYGALLKHKWEGFKQQ